MKTTVLCIGDQHVQDSNLIDIDMAFKRIIKIVRKIKPTFIVCMGDMLHNHEKISVTPFNRALYFLDELSKLSLTYILIGNHDYKNNTQFLSDNHPFNSLKKWNNVVVVDKVIINEHNGLKFCFCPYVYPGRFVEALNTNKNKWEICKCIFAHQEFNGCKMGAFISENGDKWDTSYPLVISGHIHEHQIIDNIFYTGSMMQNGFAEQDDKKIWLFKFKTTKFSYISFDLKLRKKMIKYIHLDDLPFFNIKDFDKVVLKLNIKGENTKINSFRSSKKYKEIIDSGIKISFTPEYEDITISKNINGKTYIDILYELIENNKDSKKLLKRIISNL